MKDKILSRVAMGICGSMGTLAELKIPQVILKPAIEAYSLGFGVNRSEIQEPTDGYACFGDFFARSLKDGVRSICPDDDAFISPCDGTIAAVDSIESAGHSEDSTTFLVKGFDYSINQLVGNDVGNLFSGGGGMVIYLHPRDYHRVHVPAGAVLRQVRHIAGSRFPVAPWAEKRVSGIFQRNERMVFHFELGKGTLVLIMVAAFGVGHIVTPFAPPKGGHTSAVRFFDAPIPLNRGDELGAFRLGSTVVMLWTEQLLSLSPAAVSGTIRFGEKLGVITQNNAVE
ncbi:MAG: phosphatidylserine decarboxylase [Deltaproteobacteria bacterium]|nr:phosphatidylserine decarboxylase [Deltaproteobacteria bacterium]